MLCSKLYGFVIPPAPAIFVDRSGGTGAVVDAVDRFVTKRSMTPPPELTANRHDHADYLHRVTVVPHERRHFHDLLATTIGNHTFYASVALTLKMLTGLYFWIARERRKVIPLPLPYWGVDVSTCPDVHELDGKVRKLCEASALLAQHATVAMGVDGDSIYALTRSFLNTPPYGEILSSLNALLARLEPEPEVLRDIGLLVLAAMCEEPSRPFEDRDEAFMQRLAAWAQLDGALARNDLRTTAQQMWERGRRGLLNVEANLALWRKRIDHLLKAHTDEVGDLVHSMVNEFDTHARTMRQRLIDDPMVYADPHRYLTTDWVTPIAYSVTADTAPKLAEPIAGLKYMDRELCHRFGYGLAPARNLPYTATQPHERLWFRCWLIAHEETFGVRFVLPQDNHDYQRLRAEVGGSR